MRTFFVAVIILAVASLALAGGDCGRRGKCCDRPESEYTYSSIYYMPDCAPMPLKCFWNSLISMHEARVSHEASYIRDNVCPLPQIARKIVKDDCQCCPEMRQKHFKRAAKDLVKDCDRLQELAYGASNGALYTQLKQVEEDFIRLSNLCED
jgi:hypothetical protein